MARVFVASIPDAELTKALKQIDAYDGKARLRVERVMANATRRIKNGAIRRVAVRSGTLKKSIKSSFSAPKLTGTIRATAPHAHLIEFGARATTAEPEKKKFLKFERSSGKVVYVRRARIPARSPRPFITPAYEAERANLINDIKKAVDDK